MEVIAGKDKIILKEVTVFEKQSDGFKVENAENHYCGVIHSVPWKEEDNYSVGETVVLRSKAVLENLLVDGVKYSFIQPLDIICRLQLK